jgi:lipopolysaccharide transport system permease protein
MLADIRKLPDYRELIVNFALREIKAKYKQALLGVTWAIIQPVVLMGMMTVVFSYVARVPSEGIPYPLFLFAALLPWQFFAGTLSRGTGSLTNQSGLITKIYFPRESLVLASLAAAFVDFVIATLVFVALLGYYGVAPTLTWLWVIPILAVQLALSLGLMLFLAPLNTIYRDVGQAMPLFIQVWMYATPIMYPASLVPASIRPYYLLNPMAAIIESYRSAMLRNQMPDLPILAWAAFLAALLLFGGYYYFTRLESGIADVA